MKKAPAGSRLWSGLWMHLSRPAYAAIEHTQNLFAITPSNLLESFLEGNRGRCRARSSKPLGDVRRSRWVRLPLSSAKPSLQNAGVRANLRLSEGCRIIRACDRRASTRALSQYALEALQFQYL